MWAYRGIRIQHHHSREVWQQADRVAEAASRAHTLSHKKEPEKAEQQQAPG